MPGIPDIQLDPNLVLLVFLPPLLYASAFFADIGTLRSDARVISLTAVGLVIATAVVVAVIARAALERVDELSAEVWTRDGTIERVRNLYRYRRRFKVRAGKLEDEDGIEEASPAYQRLMHEIYAAHARSSSACATAARSAAT